MKPYPLAPLNHLTVPFSFTKATPLASLFRFISAADSASGEKAVLLHARKPFAQQHRPLAVIRHNQNTAQSLALPVELPTALQKHQPECALRDDRRELRMILGNSGFCKAICFQAPQQKSSPLHAMWLLKGEWC